MSKYRYDIDVSNRIVSAASISIFSIYRPAQFLFLFLRIDFIYSWTVGLVPVTKNSVTTGIRSIY